MEGDSALPAPAYGATLRDAVRAGFEGRVEPVPLSVPYRLGLAAVAAAMVLLPVPYLGLICGAGWGVYTWAVVGLTVVPGGFWAKLLLFATPLVAGATVVVFLVKPLFARPLRLDQAVRLSEHDEPLFFDFVGAICSAVGAPRPEAIEVDCQVNASAGLRRGFRSLVGGDLVLTVGAPLIAGLRLDQLAGVLAHEFGHFSQRSALRLTYVIRRLNHWFERVVFERDTWDAWLVASSREGDVRLRLVFGTARGAVWLSRRALWVLMRVGHGISSFQLRQMEFDADRYEARLVGAAVFESTMRELFALTVAHQQALGQLGEAWREGRLADSLPLLVTRHRTTLAAELAPAFEQHLGEAKTGAFDTHPADRDRLANVQREGPRPLFSSPLPAAAAFRDFPALARRASLAFYRDALGDQLAPEKLVPSEELVAQEDLDTAEREAATRVFGGLFDPCRPLPLPAALPPPGSPGDEVRRRLAAARSRATGHREAAAMDLERRKSAEGRYFGLLQVGALRSAGRKVEAARWNLSKGDVEAARDLQDSVAAQVRSPSPALAAAGEAAAERVALALELVAAAQGSSLAAELAPVVAAGHRLAGSAETLDGLRESCAALSALWGEVQGETRDAALVREITAETDRCHRLLRTLHGALAGAPYPFSHRREALDLGTYVLPDVPLESDLYAVFTAAAGALQSIGALYLRILGRLAALLERVEAELEPPGPTQVRTT